MKCLKCGFPTPPIPPPLEYRDDYYLEYRKDGWGQLRLKNGHKTNGIGTLITILMVTIMVVLLFFGLINARIT